MPQNIKNAEFFPYELSEPDYFPGLPLKAIQKSMADMKVLLEAENTGPELLRHSKSDLLETLLVRAHAVFVDAPQYRADIVEARKERFLSLHLGMAILGWLAMKASDPDSLNKLNSAKQKLLLSQ